MGMLGKAWSTGALMMVQVADTLPKAFHPRTKLEGGHLCRHVKAQTARASFLPLSFLLSIAETQNDGLLTVWKSLL